MAKKMAGCYEMGVKLSLRKQLRTFNQIDEVLTYNQIDLKLILFFSCVRIKAQPLKYKILFLTYEIQGQEE